MIINNSYETIFGPLNIKIKQFNNNPLHYRVFISSKTVKSEQKTHIRREKYVKQTVSIFH